MPPARREICIQVEPTQETEEQVTARVARATAVLLRIAKRLDAANRQNKEPDDTSSLAAVPLPNDA